MKNFFLILFSFVLLIATSCSTAERPDTKPTKSEIVQPVGEWQTAMAADIDAPVYFVQAVEDPPGIPVGEPSQSPSDFLKNNWIELLFGLIGFAEVVVRLTKTEKDNSILNFVMTIINAILPNRSRGGGTFPLKE